MVCVQGSVDGWDKDMRRQILQWVEAPEKMMDGMSALLEPNEQTKIR